MRQRILAPLALATVTGLALAGCASGSASSAADSILIGTTDKVTVLDPAGSWDLGSAALQNQVFAWLLTSAPGSTEPSPDLAASAEFTAPNEYTVTLRDGLAFANGNALTASDVKFSFDRQLAIADPYGPSPLLGDLVSVETEGEDTIVFTLATDDNALWPQVLTSPAAAIVDEEVFAADAITSDADIVAGKAFDGQYAITSYSLNDLVQLERNDAYDGLLGPAKTEKIVVKYYANESNLKLDVQQGGVQLAYRTLSATDIESLRGSDTVTVHTGPGVEIRFVAFNLENMPYGSATADADPAKALAVRAAAADLLDRELIAEQIYKNTYTPLYSVVPSGMSGSIPAYELRYGDAEGGPSVEAATARLAAAGVSTPVELNLQYNSDHYGGSSADEYALVKNQLEDSGLFTVNLQTTEWTQYVKEIGVSYPAYQLGWFSDYPDADNYLALLYSTPEAPSVLGEAIQDDAYNALVQEQRVTIDPDARLAIIGQAQEAAADKAVILPLLEGSETVVAANRISGVTDSLDGSGRFRFGLLSIK